MDEERIETESLIVEKIGDDMLRIIDKENGLMIQMHIAEYLKLVE